MESLGKLAAGDTLCEEYRISRKDGQERWVRETGVPGNRRAMCTILELREPKQPTERTEIRLAAILDKVPFEFWAPDAVRAGTMDLNEKMESIPRAAKHSQRMGALSQISQAFASSLDFEQIVRSATNSIGEVLDCLCCLLKVDPNTCQAKLHGGAF